MSGMTLHTKYIYEWFYYRNPYNNNYIERRSARPRYAAVDIIIRMNYTNQVGEPELKINTTISFYWVNQG